MADTSANALNHVILPRPVIVVDWTDCELERELLFLKAAVTVYEEAQPMPRYNSPTTHRLLLRRLKEVLPEGVLPSIVTDAGFRGHWFRDVESYG